MTTEQSYKTKGWGVTIFWGYDVTGDESDIDETAVYIEPSGTYSQNDAVTMARYILQELVGE